MNRYKDDTNMKHIIHDNMATSNPSPENFSSSPLCPSDGPPRCSSLHTLCVQPNHHKGRNGPLAIAGISLPWPCQHARSVCWPFAKGPMATFVGRSVLNAIAGGFSRRYQFIITGRRFKHFPRLLCCCYAIPPIPLYQMIQPPPKSLSCRVIPTPLTSSHTPTPPLMVLQRATKPSHSPASLTLLFHLNTKQHPPRTSLPHKQTPILKPTAIAKTPTTLFPLPKFA